MTRLLQLIPRGSRRVSYWQHVSEFVADGVGFPSIGSRGVCMQPKLAGACPDFVRMEAEIYGCSDNQNNTQHC